MEKQKILKELQKLPGVGKQISEDLYKLNIKKISDLKNKNPQKLYLDLCKIQNAKVDKCMLYVFRCIISYVNQKNQNSSLQDFSLFKWWDFKDKK